MLFLLGGSSPAPGGAALAPAGSGQIIETLSASTSSVFVDDKGARRPAAIWREQELSTFLEWGATDSLTLFAAASAERAAAGGTKAVLGVEPTELGARAALWSGGDQTLAVQASALLPSTPSALACLSEAGQAPGFDGRLAYFRNFRMLGLAAFASAEAGWRLIGYEGVSEFRADWTVGLRPTGRLLLLIQGFGVSSRVPAAVVWSYGRPAYEKAQLSLVYDLDKDWSIQTGGFATALARDSRRERGAILALWRRF